MAGKHRTPGSGLKGLIAYSLIDVSGKKTYRNARQAMPPARKASITGSYAKVAQATTPRRPATR